MVDMYVKWQYFFGLRVETLFLAIYVFDNYLAVYPVVQRSLSVLFVTCVFIAAKYEEVKIVRLDNFLTHCKEPGVTADAVLEQERDVLEKLNYKLVHICPYDFLKRVFYVCRTDLDKCKLTRRTRVFLH